MSLRIQTSSYWDTNGRILAGIGRRGRGGARRDKVKEMCPRRSNECDNDISKERIRDRDSKVA